MTDDGEEVTEAPRRSVAETLDQNWCKESTLRDRWMELMAELCRWKR
jgi:hypothetical protein